jgi:hypothetical protein
MKIPRTPKLANPVMLDKAIGALQDALADRVGWLDYSFGRVQRLITERDGRAYYYPAVHVDGGEYLNVLPGQSLGNRSFFVINDPHVVESNGRRYATISSPFALVLWFDLERVFPGTTERNTEEIKRQILNVLRMAVLPSGCSFSIAKIYERAENIFKEFSIKEIESQYLMQPYAGLRIEGEIKYMEDCEND